MARWSAIQSGPPCRSRAAANAASWTPTLRPPGPGRGALLTQRTPRAGRAEAGGPGTVLTAGDGRGLPGQAAHLLGGQILDEPVLGQSATRAEGLLGPARCPRSRPGRSGRGTRLCRKRYRRTYTPGPRPRTVRGRSRSAGLVRFAAFVVRVAPDGAIGLPPLAAIRPAATWSRSLSGDSTQPALHRWSQGSSVLSATRSTATHR